MKSLILLLVFVCIVLCGCEKLVNHIKFEKYFDSTDNKKYPVLDLSKYKVIEIRLASFPEHEASHIDVFTVDSTDVADLFHYIKASKKLLNWAYKNIATCGICGNSYPVSEMTELTQYGNISNFWVCKNCKKYVKKNIKNNLKEINKP